MSHQNTSVWVDVPTRTHSLGKLSHQNTSNKNTSNQDPPEWKLQPNRTARAQGPVTLLDTTTAPRPQRNRQSPGRNGDFI
ncbi:hypothetical protein MRX96_026809 [Rhipicephalus microplus]